MDDDSSVATDGGRPEESEFIAELAESGASDFSRRDQIVRFVDVYILAPARVARKDWRTVVGSLFLFIFLLMGTVGTRVTDRPRFNDAPRYIEPFNGEYMHTISIDLFGGTLFAFEFWRYPFGTGGFGQPLLPSLIHATPAMMELVAAGVLMSILVGAVIGTTAGYAGGRVDTVLMIVTDIMLTVPGLPLIIVLAAVWTPTDAFAVGLILAIDNWPGLARSVRSQVLTIREENYVEASKSLGLNTRDILPKDILPQMMPYVLINAAGSGRAIIFESVGLYFLGILPSGSIMNWGVMLNTAYNEGALVNPNRYHWLYVPMVAIIFVSFGLILLSQGMDRLFNARLRARHSKTVGGDDDSVEDL
jgi:peptide/nickel transport system permease protein